MSRKLLPQFRVTSVAAVRLRNHILGCHSLVKTTTAAATAAAPPVPPPPSATVPACHPNFQAAKVKVQGDAAAAGLGRLGRLGFLPELGQ